jgi:DNA-binding MurR/RpiR family transcriptional regulator
VLLLITLPPHQTVLKPILSYAATSRLNVITITDRNSMLESQRYSKVVLPCHVASFGLGASHTAVSSAIRLLALTYAAQAGKSAQQRAEIVASIHDELGDME